MKRGRFESRIFTWIISASVPVLLCSGCSSDSASADRLLLACSNTDGNSCKETYGDSSVSGFMGSCATGSETSTSACSTSAIFGECVTPVVGGTHDTYYYYNFGFPKNCSDLGGSYTAVGNQHIVGTGAATYTEVNETANSVSTTPESTAYTLNNTGVVISGTFEASSPTVDYFSFNSGNSSWIVIRSFVSGALSTVNVSTQCTGFSSTSNINQLGRVGIPSNLSCNVSVSPTSAVAGASYTIEMKSLP